jgi:hypothetical protein
MAAMEPMTQTVTSSKPPEEARAAVMAVLDQLGATTIDGEDPGVQARTGKKLGTRLLGAMFVPDEWLPLHHSFAFNAAGDGTEVEITVGDDLGVGIRSGFKAKYETLMTRRLGELSNALA